MSLARLKAELAARQVFKAWEIEENLDRYFCRPVAVLMTAAFHPLGITPNQVSVLAVLVGMLGAFFLFGPSLGHLILAVALLWLAEVLDAADGQLARLATRPSRLGRIVDGICGNLFYVVIYFTLGRGLMARHGTPLYAWLAFAAALAHSLQGSLYDFYRTEYIRIAKKRESMDPDALEALARAQQAGGDKDGLGSRIMLAIYHNYVWRQAVTTPTYQPLSQAIARHFEGRPIPQEFADHYAGEQRKMVRWWNYLGSNSHLIILSVAVLCRRPEWYLWATVIAFTLYAVAASVLQSRTSLALRESLERGRWSQGPTTDPEASIARAL